MIPIESIGAKGRKVKCMKCEHIWLASLTEKELLELNKPRQENVVESEKSKDKIRLPKIHQNKTNKFIYLLHFSLLTSLCAVLFVFFHQELRKIPLMNSIYEKMSIVESQDFVIKEASFQKIIENGTKVYYLHISIINNSNEARKMPSLKLAVLNENFEELPAESKSFGDKILKPGEEHKFDRRMQNFIRPAKYVSFDVGNDFELMFR